MSSREVQIQPGTVVVLCSGGARMTVAEVTDGIARVVWFQPRPLQLQEARVPLAALALPADDEG